MFIIIIIIIIRATKLLFSVQVKVIFFLLNQIMMKRCVLQLCSISVS